MTDSGRRIAADLEAAIGEGAHLDPATYYRVQRRCISLIRSGDVSSVALLVGASIASAMAERLEAGEGVTPEVAENWRAVGELLAGALAESLADLQRPVWTELVTGIFPPEGQAAH